MMWWSMCLISAECKCVCVCLRVNASPSFCHSLYVWLFKTKKTVTSDENGYGSKMESMVCFWRVVRMYRKKEHTSSRSPSVLFPSRWFWNIRLWDFCLQPQIQWVCVELPFVRFNNVPSVHSVFLLVFQHFFRRKGCFSLAPVKTVDSEVWGLSRTLILRRDDEFLKTWFFKM